MKRLFVLVLTMAFMIGSIVTLAETEFDMWKGYLGGTDITFEDHYYGDAEGHVILNYIKGQQNYVVNMVCEGLKPGQEYDFKFIIVDDSEGVKLRQEVGSFTADDDGVGNLNVRGFIPEIKGFADEDEAFFNIYIGDRRLVSTSEDRFGIGDLAPVGSNRGE